MEQTVVSDDGCRLWVDADGHGAPVVLCHGGPGLWDYLGDVAALLGGGGVRTVRWDQRGCGRSERRGPYTVGRFVADLDAVRERAGKARVALLGHSWGAHLALRYAMEHPEQVSRLVYVSGTGVDADRAWRPGYHEGLRRRLGPHRARWAELDGRARTAAEEREWAVLQWSADFADAGRALRQAEAMATPWLGINADCNRELGAEVEAELANGEVLERCRRIEVPVLIVDGSDDIRPRGAVDSLEQALPGVRRVTLNGGGHLPWVERPEEFRAAVLGFLAEHRARSLRP